MFEIKGKKIVESSIESPQELTDPKIYNAYKNVCNYIKVTITEFIANELPVQDIAANVPSYNPEWCVEEYDEKQTFKNAQAIRECARVIARNYFDKEYITQFNAVESLDNKHCDKITESARPKDWYNKIKVYAEEHFDGTPEDITPMQDGTYIISYGEDEYIVIIDEDGNVKDDFEESVKFEEASYGGAFDIADDQYFTREDINKLADVVLGHVSETFPEKFEIGDAYINNGLACVILVDEDNDGWSGFAKIDMRKIKRSDDLADKYGLHIASQIISQIKQEKYFESIDSASISDIEKTVDDLKAKYPNSDVYYDGDSHTIKISLDENIVESSLENNIPDNKKEELKSALEDAANKLALKQEMNIKAYEIAFQDAIEKVFPDKSWWDVTDCNIFMALFQTHDIYGTVEAILDGYKL